MHSKKPALFAFIFSFLASAPAAAQRGASNAPSLQIDVQVRNPDGSPGPRGVRVLLDSPEGGIYADCVTTEDGKCRFVPRDTGVYLVRIQGGGYRDVTERIELVNNRRGFATLTLRKVDDSNGASPSSEAPSGEINVADYNIPEKARQEYDQGAAALQEKKLTDSIKHFQKAVSLYDSYPQAYWMLGKTYMEQQDWKKSEEALKRSIALNPKIAAPYIDLGAVYNQEKNYSQAVEALHTGVSLSPDAPAAKYELAKAYWGAGRWPEAAPLAEIAVKELPDLGPAHVLLANIRLKQRNAPGALQEYQEYLRLEPEGSMAPQVRDMVAKLQKALGQ